MTDPPELAPPGPDEDAPLVSCLLVARLGGGATQAAIARFQRQSYPRRELIVLDVSEAGVGAQLTGGAGIRYERLAAGLDAEHATAHGVSLARGPLVAAWDEGAGYPRWRLSAQVRGLLATGRAISVAPGREGAGVCGTCAGFARIRWGARPDGLSSPIVAPGPVHVVRHPGMLDDAAEPPGEPAGPVATCIMPTFNRREFVPRAVGYFLAQDLLAAELIVVDDGTDPIGALLPEDPRIRYVRLAERASIGAKRNLACELARADVLVQWDDDDWYSPARLRLQTERLLHGQSELTGLSRAVLLDLRGLQFWACEADPTEAGIAAGTLAFTRELWARCRGYPDESVGEDFALLHSAARMGARIASVPGDGCYVYLRHRANAWRFDFDPGEGPGGWRAINAPDYFPESDLRFYAGLAGVGGRAA